MPQTRLAVLLLSIPFVCCIDACVDRLQHKRKFLPEKHWLFLWEKTKDMRRKGHAVVTAYLGPKQHKEGVWIGQEVQSFQLLHLRHQFSYLDHRVQVSFHIFHKRQTMWGVKDSGRPWRRKELKVYFKLRKITLILELLQLYDELNISPTKKLF